MRYFFEVAYKGTNYHGWQIQKNAVSIQQIFNEALSMMLGESIETIGSSRTDTGVHAIQQFFHLDIDHINDPDKLQYKLNSYLPHDLSVKRILPVKDDAHSRFDAKSRYYKYYIIKEKDPFWQDTALIIRRDLDVKAMNKAAKLVIGEHDFQSFCRNSKSMDNHFCKVKKASWEEKDSNLIFHIKANRFLRGMVRTLVGTLLQVGDKEISVTEFKKILEAKNRKMAGPAASAKGLFLMEVKYPQDIFTMKTY